MVAPWRYPIEAGMATLRPLAAASLAGVGPDVVEQRQAGGDAAQGVPRWGQCRPDPPGVSGGADGVDVYFIALRGRCDRPLKRPRFAGGARLEADVRR